MVLTSNMMIFRCPTGKWNKNKLKARAGINLIMHSIGVRLLFYVRRSFVHIIDLNFYVENYTKSIAYSVWKKLVWLADSPFNTNLHIHIFSLKNRLLFWKNAFISWMYIFWVLIHMCLWSTDNVFQVTTILEADQR